MGKSSINVPFSMAMLNNKRVMFISTYMRLLGKKYNGLFHLFSCYLPAFYWFLAGWPPQLEVAL